MGFLGIKYRVVVLSDDGLKQLKVFTSGKPFKSFDYKGWLYPVDTTQQQFTYLKNFFFDYKTYFFNVSSLVPISMNLAEQSSFNPETFNILLKNKALSDLTKITSKRWDWKVILIVAVVVVVSLYLILNKGSLGV